MDNFQNSVSILNLHPSYAVNKRKSSVKLEARACFSHEEDIIIL